MAHAFDFLAFAQYPNVFIWTKTAGKRFTFYAVFTVTIYSVTAWLITDVFPVDVSVASPLAGTDLLLCALFGGIISGTGSGLAIRFGGAMDGVEVMAVIFAKKIGISVGTFMMIYNLILYLICGIVINSWILPLYSIVTYAAALKTVDYIIEGFDRSKSAMIITVKADEICNALSEEFGSSATKIDARGGYSNEQKTVVYYVVNRFQIVKMKNIVHEIEQSAYITISEVADVFRHSN